MLLKEAIFNVLLLSQFLSTYAGFKFILLFFIDFIKFIRGFKFIRGNT